VGPDGDSYSFEKDVSITNSTASNLTDYQVKLTLNTASLISGGQMQADCDDLRFAETDNANIPYWIESGCNATSTVVWLKTNLAASATKTVYMYYGNSNVSSAASGSSVFAFFDDFEGQSSLDASKWTVSGTGTNTVSGGIMTSTGTSNYVIRSQSAFGTGYAVRARLKSAHFNVATHSEYFNFQNDSSNGLGALYANTSAGYQGRYYTQITSGSYSATPITGWAADTYAVQDIIRGTSSGIFRVNDANEASLRSGSRSCSTAHWWASRAGWYSAAGTRSIFCANCGSLGTMAICCASLTV
jgi:hypothetical protein